MKIPFVRPFLGEDEIKAVTEALRNGNIHGDGPIGKKVEAKLKVLFGSKHALLATSGTHALEMALMALKIMPGDEVILPSFTFVSTANAVMLQGARPVFAEIDLETLNIDPRDIEKKITKKTKAIIPVHYGGIGCRMDEIMYLAKKNNIYVVEDAAQGVDAKYKGRYLGTIGDVGCYSFHETKNITCGEGGALMTDDDDVKRRAEIIREKGTNRSAFLRGEVDKYTWIDKGSSYVNSDILSAVLDVQLDRVKEITVRRRKIYDYYNEALKDLAEAERIYLPEIPPECEHNGHIFYFRLRTEKERYHYLAELKKRGIGATFHYIPLHSSPYGREVLGYKAEDLPVTELVSKTLIRLPLYPQMTDREIEYIVDNVRNVIGVL